MPKRHGNLFEKCFTLEALHAAYLTSRKGKRRKKAILEFERSWWRYAGAKEASIKELFDLDAPKYYRLLNDLIDREDALAASPMLVKRLRRLREARTQARSTR